MFNNSYNNIYSIIINLFSFIIIINRIQSISYLYTLSVAYNLYFRITPNYISFFSNYDNNDEIRHTFEGDQMLTSEEDTQMISHGKFFDKEDITLLMVKDYVYILTDYGAIHCSPNKIINLTRVYSEITPLRCIEVYCQFVLEIINENNKLLIKYFTNMPDDICGFYNVYNLESNLTASSDNLSCHFDGDTIICFFENDHNELVASFFNVDFNSNKTLQYSASYEKSNIQAKIIKSMSYSNYSKYYVCYIDDENYCDCLIFDKSLKQWSDSINYLNGCLIKSNSFNFKYFDSLSYYTLSCFQSVNEFSYVQFDENFKQINQNESSNYYLNESLIKECQEYSLSSLVNDFQSNIIKIFGICNDTINKYPIQQKPLELTIIQRRSTKTKEEIINNLDNIMENYDLKKIYEIFGDDYKIKISPINSKKYKNIPTYIDFSNCEKIMRTKEELSSSKLTVFQIEIDNINERNLINNVEYVIFDENKKILNLSDCENAKIEIYYQIDTSMINKTKVTYYSELGIDVFNIKDDFFNDICYPYSENNSDMILKDRIFDIYQNYSICEKNCEYNKIDLIEYIASCKCDVKTKVETKRDPPKLDTVVLDSIKDTNLAVIICYQLVFDFKNKLNNIGFIIFSCLLLIHIPIIIHYFIFNTISIKKYIVSQMIKYSYWLNEKKNPMKKGKSFKDKRKEADSEEIIIKDKKKFENNIKNEIKGQQKKSKRKSKKIKFIEMEKKIIDKNSIIKGSSCMNLKHINSTNKALNINEKDNITINKKIGSQNSSYGYKKSKNNKVNEKEKNDVNIINKKIKTIETGYSLIQIDANNSLENEPLESHIILDNYNYDNAIKYDKRSFLRILLICILTKENIINILFFRTPLDLQSLRIILFIFQYSCDLAFNTIFYSNENISDKYHYEGKNIFVFSIIHNFIQSLISSVISEVIVFLFQHMIDTRSCFEDIFKDEEEKLRKNKNYKVNKDTKLKMKKEINKIYAKLGYKIVIFLISEIIIMFFFYYFVTAFCEVYQRTQLSWLYDFFISFLLSLIGEIFLALVLSALYSFSIKFKFKLFYKVALFVYNL